MAALEWGGIDSRLGRKLGNQELKVILAYSLSLKPTWAPWDPVYQQTDKTKASQEPAMSLPCMTASSTWDAEARGFIFFLI